MYGVQAICQFKRGIVWSQYSERRIVSVTGPQYVCGNEKSRLFTFEQFCPGSSW